MAPSRSSSVSRQSQNGAANESPVEASSPAAGRTGASRTRQSGRRGNASSVTSPESQVSQLSNSLRSRVRRRQRVGRRGRRTRTRNLLRRVISRPVGRPRNQTRGPVGGTPRSSGPVPNQSRVRTRVVRRAQLSTQQPRRNQGARPRGRPPIRQNQATQTDESYGFNTGASLAAPRRRNVQVHRRLLFAPRNRVSRVANPRPARHRRREYQPRQRVRNQPRQRIRQPRRVRVRQPRRATGSVAATGSRLPQQETLSRSRPTFSRAPVATPRQPNPYGGQQFPDMSSLMSSPMFQNLFSGAQQPPAQAGSQVPLASPLDDASQY